MLKFLTLPLATRRRLNLDEALRTGLARLTSLTLNANSKVNDNNQDMQVRSRAKRQGKNDRDVRKLEFFENKKEKRRG